MKRLDVALFELKLARSRNKAQELIAGGDVEVFMHGKWKRIKQVSLLVDELAPEKIRLNPASEILKYVSRAGLKLEGALEHLQLDVRGLRALDVGISTGGFTDCLLQAGCVEVIGVDVGHGQLAEQLQADERVQLFEGVNARALDESPEVRSALSTGIDLCVVDVSFISLTLILPAVARVLPPSTQLLALVKPQFEVGAAALDGQGIVRDPQLYAQVKTQILRALEKCGFSITDPATHYFASRLKGQDGNQEFFVYSHRT